MTSLRRLPALACLCSTLALAGAAGAADPDPAEVYFERGLDHMEAKRYELACPAIEESYKLDPRPGTLFTLAECEALLGRAATAIARYDEYLAVYAGLSDAQKRKQKTRGKDAQAQRAALAREAPELRLVLPPDAPPGTTVERDGAAVPPEMLGKPILVDPGEHVVKAQAPGSSAVELRVRIGKGEKKTLTLEVKGAPAPAVQPAPAPALAPTPQAPAPGPAQGAPTPDEGPSGRRVAAYVAGGIGLAGIIAGGVTGGLAIERKGVVDANCEDTRCNPEGKDAADTLKRFGLVSTIGFGVGLAGLGAATVLLLTEPSPAAGAQGAPGGARRWVSAGVAPSGPAGVSVEVRGAW